MKKPLYTILILLSLAGCGKKKTVEQKTIEQDWSYEDVAKAVPNIRQAMYEEGAIDLVDNFIKNGRNDFIKTRNEMVEEHNICIDSILKYLPGAKSYKKYDVMLDSLGNGDIGKADAER